MSSLTPTEMRMFALQTAAGKPDAPREPLSPAAQHEEIVVTASNTTAVFHDYCVQLFHGSVIP